MWKNALQEDLQLLSLNDSNSQVVSRQSYYTLQVSGQSLYGGGCVGWTSWLASEVRGAASSSVPASLTLWSRRKLRQAEAESYAVTSCREKSVVQSLMTALLPAAGQSGRSNNGTVQVFLCNNRLWKVQRNCSRSSTEGDVAVCVDCANPCSSNSLAGVAPCASTSGSSSYQIVDPSMTLVSVAFHEIDQPPVIKLILAKADAYAVSVNVSLSKPGTVVCSLFGKGLSPPSSTEELLLQRTQGSASSIYDEQTKNNVSSIVIASGVSPLTSYTLYCYAISAASNAKTSLTAMLAQAVQDVTTACCRRMHVRLASASIPEGVDQTSGFLSAELEGGRPRSDLQVRMVLQKVDVSNSSEVIDMLPSSSFVPSFYSLTTSSVPSSSSSLILTSALTRLTAGSYRLSLNLTGPSVADYSLVYYGATPASSSTATSAVLTVLPSTFPLPAPSMLSATFASDGTFVQVVFSGETNRGGMPSRFDCSRLFRFACAETSTCVWSDARNVFAYVSKQTGCAMPGQVLSLAPSAAIKARCMLAGCTTQTQLSWPNISTAAASSFLTISPPSVPLRPTVAMSMPSSVGSCSFVLIDATASTGDGGRGWNSSVVTVSSIDVNGNVRDSTALQ
eukprot:gene35258-42720_t